MDDNKAPAAYLDKLDEAAKRLPSNRLAKVNSAEEYAKAADLLAVAVGVRRDIEAARLKFVAPLNDRVSAINAAARAAAKPAQELEAALQGLMRDWRAREAEELAAKEAKAAKLTIAAAKADKEVAFDAKDFRQNKTVTTAKGQVIARKRWACTGVTDKAKVPLAYMEVNMVAVNAAVRSGIREIDGLKIEEVEDIGVRR